MLKKKNLGQKNEYVYDISLDGTVVIANGNVVCSNTDGFNMQLPQKHRYTKENPYISTGAGRVNKKGKEYVGLEADVAEFNDLFLYDRHPNEFAINKLGIDIDETITSSINVSRKNYIDYFGEKNEYKFVGNSIKSKKAQGYCEKFLNMALPYLAHNNGKDFLEVYYNYIDKIYNYQIPLKDIASKGKIKKSIKEYIEDTKSLTKAGRPKSRQAWYELAIKENLIVNNGDTVYYINTGTSKSQSDVKRVSHAFIYNANGEKEDITKRIDSEYTKYKKQCKADNVAAVEKSIWVDKNYPNRIVEDEIILNCVAVPDNIINSEYDIYSNENNTIEYNVDKYIDIFNNKVRPLLVCFDKKIRDSILITKPSDRNYFTEEECMLVSGQPNKPQDQDDIDDVLKIEDKEIAFYIKYGLKPLYLEECGQGKWEDIVQDYNNRMEREKNLGIDKIKEQYREILDKMTEEDLENVLKSGTLPKELSKIVEIDPVSGKFVSNQYEDAIIGSLNDFLDLYSEIGSKSDDYGDVE